MGFDPLSAQPKSNGGWMKTLVVVVGLLALDFSPALTVMNQQTLGTFVTSVGVELFAQYTERVTKAGLFTSAATDKSARQSVVVLGLASNLAGSPFEAAKASLKLGEIQSRHLGDWSSALASFKQAEAHGESALAAKYHVARCYVELGQYEQVMFHLFICSL